VALSTLKPWAGNPRKNKAAIKSVAASIRRFGFGAPILARRADREIIAGHTRALAAESLGIESVPVRFLDLDPADAHLLALADNKLGELAEWDSAAVASVLSDYSLDDAAFAGFGSEELEKLGDDALDAAPQLDGLEFRVIVDCKDEREQGMLLEKLESDGYTCRPLMS
jgi:ParB-like chromosome segregation protein Spo0J